jgi:hypothetical protein
VYKRQALARDKGLYRNYKRDRTEIEKLSASTSRYAGEISKLEKSKPSGSGKRRNSYTSAQREKISNINALIRVKTINMEKDQGALSLLMKSTQRSRTGAKQRQRSRTGAKQRGMARAKEQGKVDELNNKIILAQRKIAMGEEKTKALIGKETMETKRSSDALSAKNKEITEFIEKTKGSAGAIGKLNAKLKETKSLSGGGTKKNIAALEKQLASEFNSLVDKGDKATRVGVSGDPEAEAIRQQYDNLIAGLAKSQEAIRTSESTNISEKEKNIKKLADLMTEAEEAKTAKLEQLTESRKAKIQGIEDKAAVKSLAAKKKKAAEEVRLENYKNSQIASIIGSGLKLAMANSGKAFKQQKQLNQALVVMDTAAAAMAAYKSSAGLFPGAGELAASAAIAAGAVQYNAVSNAQLGGGGSISSSVGGGAGISAGPSIQREFISGPQTKDFYNDRPQQSGGSDGGGGRGKATTVFTGNQMGSTNVNYTISAIDTQSGTQFLMNNAGTISAMTRQGLR